MIIDFWLIPLLVLYHHCGLILLQLNPKRATDRRKPQTITSVNQPFNPDQFNFTKIRPQELLFNICPPVASGDHVPHENGITEKKNDKEEVRNQGWTQT